jgi:hypothetical protein
MWWWCGVVWCGVQLRKLERAELEALCESKGLDQTGKNKVLACAALRCGRCVASFCID